MATNELPESGSGITIQLEGFAGPLDLLLHLIKREEIDIWNIPIARITQQYLDYIELMKEVNINVAGEWLVMAATARSPTSPTAAIGQSCDHAE